MLLRLHQTLDVAELGCLTWSAASPEAGMVCPCLALDFVGSPVLTASDVLVRTALGVREEVPQLRPGGL
ncbi:hypothetical protein ACGFWD_39855 [Streptomyces sp. NPDC048448]|uniref:hypothetical protein n=1 Tax=Streptomyces sp. NPDC048448 TaxID=3365554 RepID=UPI003720EDA3